MTQFFERGFNPQISTDPLSTEGYSRSDMNRYYGGTFLIYENEAGNKIPAFCLEFTSVETAHVETQEDGIIPVNYSKLSRFVIPNGFYLRPSKEPLLFRYQAARSQKKGLHPDFVELTRLMKDGKKGRTTFTHSALMHLLYPLERKNSKEFLVSRRNLVYSGKLFTMYQTLSAGSFKDGELSTPFEAIRQRYEEGVNNA